MVKVHRTEGPSADQQENIRNSYAQLLSVIIVISTLLAVVFLHMEIRRVGYTVLTLSQKEKQLQDVLRQKSVQLTKVTVPSRIQNMAESKVSLKKALPHQIIQMTTEGWAVAP